MMTVMATTKRSGASASRALSQARKVNAGRMLSPSSTTRSKVAAGSVTVRSAKKSGATTKSVSVAGRPTRATQSAGTEYGPRIRNVVGVLGTNSALAAFLEVSRSRITKWLSGSESPSTESAREILDLDHIISRASLVLHEDEIHNWLSSPNPFIPGNATPLSAIRTGHVSDALSAIEAEAEGAYS